MDEQYSFINQLWQEELLYEVDDDYFTHCDIHGDWCANACYDRKEISQMIAEQGFVSCPECLGEITGFD